ncbi:YdcF family protein [Novosphingobium colocasiae]|uniref:DUF218 domain-containing protein n=1 Tax=Novosphingobium colocasiae TaxID=1256513 RepID=A0A918UH39_9SPHN|nr:YdcF family protein [Novosphingobium colocasiae]GGZ07673.1 hypothetical protein GCM10011614_23260 [Novosphingobium colocasiae]
MFRRFVSFLLLAWLFGFVWFAVALPGPLGKRHTDAIIVLTGSSGRIEHALDVLHAGEAPVLLVSGVDREVKRGEFAAQYKVSARLMGCCITLGYKAYDTRSNAIEAGEWVRRRGARSVRLVTADWHMRRAFLESAREMPAGVTLLPDAVPSRPSLSALFLEYHKLMARQIIALWGS